MIDKKREFRFHAVLGRGLLDVWYLLIPALPILVSLQGIDQFFFVNALPTEWPWPVSFWARTFFWWVGFKWLLVFCHIALYQKHHAYLASAWQVLRQSRRWMLMLCMRACVLFFAACFYVFPAFWVGIRTTYTDTLTLLTETSVRSAMKHSWRATKGHWWLMGFLFCIPVVLTFCIWWFLSFFPSLYHWQVPWGDWIAHLYVSSMLLLWVVLKLRALEELLWVHDIELRAASYDWPLTRNEVWEAFQQSSAHWYEYVCRMIAYIRNFVTTHGGLE